MRQPNILDYLPEAWASIKQMAIHAAAENPELEAIWKAVEDAYNDQFLYTMGENRIVLWEKMMNNSPLATDTLEDRRFRIINRYNSQVPYTFRMLEHHLITMCGKGEYTLNYNKDTWTLTIRIALTSRKQYDDVLKLVNEMIPVNVVLEYSLLYNKHEMLEKYTHADMTSHTHEYFRSEIIN